LYSIAGGGPFYHIQNAKLRGELTEMRLKAEEKKTEEIANAQTLAIASGPLLEFDATVRLTTNNNSIP